MFEYYDPISTSNLPLTETTLLYIIKEGENYYIKGISEGLDRLIADPCSRAIAYWPIPDVKEFLDNVEKLKLTSEIFPKNELTTNGLSLETVKAAVGFNPETSQLRSFNQQIRQELREQWVQGMLNDYQQEADNLQPESQSPHLNLGFFSISRLSVNDIDALLAAIPSHVTSDLSSNPIPLLPELINLGFNIALINRWRPNSNHPFGGFREDHSLLLIYLVNQEQLTPQEALTEINELNWLQARCLTTFYNKGLRASDLRELESYIESQYPENNFFSAIYDALEERVIDYGQSIQEALSFVKEMSFERYDSRHFIF